VSGGSVTPTSAIPDPPDPFNAFDYMLPAGSVLHRVHGEFPAGSFNPGKGKPTRFAPFINPTDPSAGFVPTLYAAETEGAAVCESVLHDVPLEGGRLSAADYRDLKETTLTLQRDVRLAMLMGIGLRRLHVDAQNITATNGDVYHRTVLWAQTAHAAGFEGLAWMSARENTAEAYMLFGDRVDASDLVETSGGRGSFRHPSAGHAWLATYCSVVDIDVLLS
jgi:hypothetical protein